MESSVEKSYVAEVRSSSTKVTATMIWKMANFTSIRNDVGEVKCEHFTFEELGFYGIGGAWKLSVTLNQTGSQGEPPRVCLYFGLTNCLLFREIDADFCIGFKQVTGAWLNTTRRKEVTYICGKQNLCAFLPHASLFAENAAFLAEGAFTVKVEFSFELPTKCTLKPESLPLEMDLQSRCVAVCQRLSSILCDRATSDFTIVSSDGVDIPAHRGILSASSPVFKAMLESDTVEKSSGRCEVSDVDEATMKFVLRYIYTGEVGDLSTVVEKVLIAADKYQIDDLRKMAVECRIRELSPTNAARALVMADQRNLQSLEEGALDFVAKNIKDFDAAGGYEELTPHSHLLVKILRAVQTYIQ